MKTRVQENFEIVLPLSIFAWSGRSENSKNAPFIVESLTSP